MRRRRGTGKRGGGAGSSQRLRATTPYYDIVKIYIDTVPPTRLENRLGSPPGVALSGG